MADTTGRPTGIPSYRLRPQAAFSATDLPRVEGRTFWLSVSANLVSLLATEKAGLGPMASLAGGPPCLRARSGPSTFYGYGRIGGEVGGGDDVRLEAVVVGQVATHFPPCHGLSLDVLQLVANRARSRACVCISLSQRTTSTKSGVPGAFIWEKALSIASVLVLGRVLERCVFCVCFLLCTSTSTSSHDVPSTTRLCFVGGRPFADAMGFLPLPLVIFS